MHFLPQAGSLAGWPGTDSAGVRVASGQRHDDEALPSKLRAANHAAPGPPNVPAFTQITRWIACW